MDNLYLIVLYSFLIPIFRNLLKNWIPFCVASIKELCVRGKATPCVLVSEFSPSAFGAWNTANLAFKAIQEVIHRQATNVRVVKAELDLVGNVRFAPDECRFSLNWTLEGEKEPLRISAFLLNQFEPNDFDSQKQVRKREYKLCLEEEFVKSLPGCKRKMEAQRALLEQFVFEAASYHKRAVRSILRVCGSDHSADIPQENSVVDSLDGLLLAPEVRQRLETDFEHFWNSRDAYRRRAQVWKRGYLFSGPPGGGKTSLVRTLASRFKMSILAMNLSDFSKDKDFLVAVSSFAVVPGRKCIVFEDVDCVTSLHRRKLPPPPSSPKCAPPTKSENSDSPDQKSKDSTESFTRGVSLETLLNYLDGLASPSETVFVLTSNRPEVLDPALIRPGRVDVHLVIEPCVDAQEIARFSAHFLDPMRRNSDPARRKSLLRFAKTVAVPERLSTAELCSALQRHLSLDLTLEEAADSVLSERRLNQSQT